MGVSVVMTQSPTSQSRVVGLLLGTAGAFFSTPLMGAVLMNVNPRDPVVFLTIAAALIAATLGASWIPARRATRVDPMVALRYE